MNRKLLHSIQLQAVYDSSGKFLDLFAGFLELVHNAYSYLLTEWDGVYPCMEQPVCILTPIREPLHSTVQECYNFHHEMIKTRCCSIFFKTLEVDPTFVPPIITCCAALHNISLGTLRRLCRTHGGTMCIKLAVLCC